MQIAVIGLLLLAANTNTNTAATEPAAAPAGAAAKAEEPKKICKREEMTGSRTQGKRICRTAEQWRKSETRF